jgi:hypothetical protein
MKQANKSLCLFDKWLKKNVKQTAPHYSASQIAKDKKEVVKDGK